MAEEQVASGGAVGAVAVSDACAGEREQVVLWALAEKAAVMPGAVLIAPWGTVQSANGDFLVDDDAVHMVLEAFATHGTDLPIDYEHQSLGGTYASPTGQAPAAGWIKALRVVRPGDACLGGADGHELEPGLYAEVDWTEAARDQLAAREYRYLSPVVIVRKRDRRVVALHSAALTNKPAIVGMKPIVNSEREDAMAETESGTRDADVVVADDSTAVNGQANPDADAVEVLRLRLGMQDAEDREAVILAADRRLGELMEAAARRDAQERVLAAVQAGKLIAAQREWALSLAMRNPAAFDEWAATAPVVVTLGRTEPPESGHAGRNRTAVIASARASYRAEPALAGLTSEAAWVAEAIRAAEKK